nr:protein NRT1/ PTR FAMILY 5.6-like [Ipomoea batatas]
MVFSISSPSKRQALFICTLILLWYSSNIGVLLLNKFLLSNYGFAFPVFLTMCHMAACAVLSYVSIVFLKVVPFQRIKSRSQFLRISTLSVVFCGSVVGGNISLRFLPVSFNQAVGATTPFFTALFAFLMTRKREAWVTYAALVPVVGGVVIASGGEPSFHWYGFIMCVSATAARAFKSVLQGVLLSSEGEKLNSMNLLLYMSPIAVLVLLPATLVLEPNVIDVTLTLATKHRYLWLLLLVNSSMAYGANLLNFLVTKNTSALTLQVLGNAKGAVAVVISILLFRNPVTFIGIAGYTMTVMGVVGYGEAKRSECLKTNPEMKRGQMGEEEGEIDNLKWVCDSSLDHKGRVPLRASTGVWKASLFIIVIEFAKRLSYYGIASSLIIYLTKIIHQDLKTAAKSVNYWIGVTTLMPLFGGFLADAFLGRFSTVLASSIVYLLGLLLLTMSRVIPSLKPCEGDVCGGRGKVHETIFFVAIYLISVGTGGHKPSLESFGADQFDDDHTEERKKKMSFFNWWNFGLCSGLLIGVTLIVYVQDHVSWALADIILSAVMSFSIVIFCVGRPVYRFRKAVGSPLTPLLQVLVAAIRKRNLDFPSNPAQLYEVPKSEYAWGRLLCHTRKLKFLDKAAIVEDKAENSSNPWRLATVTKVEEMKLLINMVPIWLTTLPFGTCVAQGTTFFIKQGAILDRKIINGFEIPPATIYALGAIGMIISITIYDRILVPVLRRATGNERGLTILQRIGIGMIFSVITMSVAALVERKRQNFVQENTTSDSMSVFWLAPQFLIIGIGDGFVLVGLQEYFYDQVPDSMRSLGIAFYLSVNGAANFLSSVLITVVDRLTEKSGRSWFGKDLNSSRLDYFYWLLGAITAANLCVYVFVARNYTYKRTMPMTDCDDANDGGRHAMV